MMENILPNSQSEVFGLFELNNDYPSESFNFDCRLKNQIVSAKIMLVRLIIRSSVERAKTTIVDIRKI